MRFSRPDADVFVPDGLAPEEAFARCTHLAIGAHPDDLEFMAYHGIAACYQKKDFWFGGVTVTDGAGSVQGNGAVSGSELARIRSDEQREAARLGGYGIQFQLGHTSADVKNREEAVVAELFLILQASKAKTLYLHNPADKHDTHIGVLRCCLEALSRLPRHQLPELVLGCEVWRGLDWMLEADKMALDCSPHPELRRQLVAVFRSQMAGGKRYDLAAEGRWVSNATYRDPHTADGCEALAWAVDLTSVVRREKPLNVWMSEKLAAFHRDVKDRLAG
jgi:LmbE family N-acetylglucosaminyl deacetylase